MKRLLLVIVILSLLLFLTACGVKTVTPTTSTLPPSTDEDSNFYVTASLSEDGYLDVLEEIKANNWYLVDVSTCHLTAIGTEYIVTYSKTPIISQCPYCNATLDQVK